jgi:hypothetical protein
LPSPFAPLVVGFTAFFAPFDATTFGAIFYFSQSLSIFVNDGRPGEKKMLLRSFLREHTYGHGLTPAE